MLLLLWLYEEDVLVLHTFTFNVDADICFLLTDWSGLPAEEAGKCVGVVSGLFVTGTLD